MYRPLKSILATALSLSLAGCGTLFGPEGYFRDRGDDYLAAEEVAALEVPAGTDKKALEELYPIPAAVKLKGDDEQVTQVAASFSVPRPTALGANAFGDAIKIQKLSDKRWILASLPPSEVWPRVRHFLSSNGLRVVYTDAINGLIETGWLQFKDSKGRKDRYRLQIEQGVQPDSTEIHILHLSVSADVTGDGSVNWPSKSINPEREAWLVDELAATLASPNSAAATSLLAQTIGGATKVELIDVDAEPVMTMSLSRTRAWATLGYAVNQQGMARMDENANIGLYYVDFVGIEEPEEDGFFSGIGSWFSFGEKPDAALESKPSNKAATSPYSLDEIISHLPRAQDVQQLLPNLPVTATDESLDDVPGYLVFVSGDSGNLQIRIRDGYGQRIETQQAKDLLKHIRRNLI